MTMALVIDLLTWMLAIDLLVGGREGCRLRGIATTCPPKRCGVISCGRNRDEHREKYGAQIYRLIAGSS
jgi:hypothetical protein